MTTLIQTARYLTGALLLIAAMTVTVTSASAQTVKLGYADAELVLINLPEYKSNAEQVQREIQSSQQELEALGAELQADVQKFEKQAPILSPEKVEERQTELQQRYAALQREGANREQQLAQMEADLMNPLIEKVGNAVNAVAAEKGLDIVFKSPGLLYVNPTSVVDITADVARRLGIQVADSAETAAAPSAAQ
jgi:outer membrane protein